MDHDDTAGGGRERLAEGCRREVLVAADIGVEPRGSPTEMLCTATGRALHMILVEPIVLYTTLMFWGIYQAASILFLNCVFLLVFLDSV